MDRHLFRRCAWAAPALLCALAGARPAAAATAAAGPPAAPAPIRTTTVDTVLVEDRRLSVGTQVLPVAPGQDVAAVLRATPFVIVQRGAPGAGDLYADGFRRHDLTFTVDCERCETACPNRMDTRLGQVDLLEIETIELARDGAGLQSGLGGTVAMRRSLPGDEWLARGRVEARAGHDDAVDGSFSLEGRGARLASRWRQVEAYTDADGRTFADRYGFARAPATVVREVRAQVRLPEGDLRAGHERSRDLLFPYLLMDERKNDRWEASGSWRGHRLYVNRTEHLMDNDLRRSAGTSRMVTDAGNTMFGAVGDRYEVYGRHWDAANAITPAANPAMGTRSHMLPDVWRWGVALRHALGRPGDPWLVARLGVARTSARDGAQLAAFTRVHEGAELSRWSLPFGVTASRTRVAAGTALTGSLELAADAPGIEQQFIIVDRPGTMTDWVGNPRLADPLRATVRLGAHRGALRAEFFGTRVSDYPVLSRAMVGTSAVQTYAAVDALLAGASLRAEWPLAAAGLGWNWGERIDGNAPLAEIQPLAFDLELRAPRWRGCTARAWYRHTTAQHRVDTSQGESATDAWNRLDLAAAYESAGVRYELALDNATGALYTQHLSYQRNPFAAGLRVWEPGRTLRLTATFGI